ncbi:MAG: small, acid-soluble spore protein, alpha/beta type [Firmicutes bacterium]|nr:small, acid-soluble spore protein, alpha/beta type [Bacillota bacterium]
MARRGKLASERLKMEAAEEVGFADKVRESGWDNVTTKEIGLMVREMIRRGERVLAQQKQQNQT